MPADIRKSIKINGEPVVELDYSALHIRMLYHKIGEEYTEDPYLIYEDEKELFLYKLIKRFSSNNSGSEEEEIEFVMKGLMNEAEKEGNEFLFDYLTSEKIRFHFKKLKKERKMYKKVQLII